MTKEELFDELGHPIIVWDESMNVEATKSVWMNFYLKKTNEVDPYKNLSFMISLSGTIFSVAYITFGIMQPLTATFKVLNTSGELGFQYVFSCLQ